MIQLTTACVSSVDETRGNTSNLLFSGQILPERNAGLNGAPSLKLEPGAACVAAVFDGNGTAAREAACYTKEVLGVAMELPETIRCGFFPENRECLRKACPYYPEASETEAEA